MNYSERVGRPKLRHLLCSLGETALNMNTAYIQFSLYFMNFAERGEILKCITNMRFILYYNMLEPLLTLRYV